MTDLGRITNARVAVVLKLIKDLMLFSMDLHILFPGKSLIFTIVEGSSELGLRCTGHISHIVGSKEMVKQEHITVPSIPVAQSRLDVDKSRVLATNIGHNVLDLTPVIKVRPV
jgi:hypothetical protein